ncbi:hypothetical protein JCM11641_006463 [Rhodosporidiobolus odoratus]
MDPHAVQQTLVMEGYLLKKKRKKMQGMGRRYFRLSSAGALSYAFNPNSPIRDSIVVSLAFISANRKHRTLDIDGGNTVYHCKALTLEEFDRWATALRQFITVAQDQAQEALSADNNTGVFPPDSPAGLHSPEFSNPAAISPEMQKVLDELSKMKQSIHDLELVSKDLHQPESHLQVPSPPQVSTSLSNSGNGNGNANGHSSKFRGFLGKRSNSTSQPRDMPAAFISSRSSSFSSAVSVLPPSAGPPTLPPIPGIVTTNEPHHLPSAFSPPSPEVAHFDSRSPQHMSPSHVSELVARQLQATIATLRASHEQLSTAVHALPRPAPPHPYLSHDSPLSPTPGFGTFARSNSGLGLQLGHTRAGPSRASSSRASFSSFFSAQEGEDWQDAVPGEFVLAEEEEPGSTISTRRSDSPEEDRRMVDSGERRRQNSSTIAESPSESEEEEEASDGEETEEEFVDGNEEDRATISGSASPAGSAVLAAKQVQRRTQLPSPVAGDEFSLLGMLRKNVGKVRLSFSLLPRVGFPAPPALTLTHFNISSPLTLLLFDFQDLSTISLPVTANEPLSLLQRIAEEFEYSDLLDRAAATKDPLERLTLVAVFAISGTAGNKYRTSRKPFNPLLGETYESIRPEKGLQFISEKVSHHPPVMAFHGEAPKKGWQVYGHIAPSQKFWGRSYELMIHGDYSVRFGDGETFSIRKPSSFVRNLVAGTKYLEVVGELLVTTDSSPAQAVVNFKEGGWGGSSTRNKVEGKIVDAHGQTAVELVGKWDESVEKQEGKASFTRLWQINEFPPNPQHYYGFSHFAITLNELTPLEAGQLAPSDSRLRPDQVAFEQGDVDEAERLKALVEEKQRTKRKEGRIGEPKWFRKEGEKWEYSGEYFVAREKKQFDDPDIFLS